MAGTKRGAPLPLTGKRSAGVGKQFRAIRLAVLAAALACCALTLPPYVTRALADYADGYQTKQSLALEDAVEVWRKAAWRQDDFFSQIKLGDIYAKDPSFRDPVEAYVWYYLALRPGHRYRVDSDRASATLQAIRSQALADIQRIFASLTLDQRQEANARIIYILSSRGSEGFMTLGLLHRQDHYYYPPPCNTPDCYTPPSPMVYRYDPHDRWYVVRLWQRIRHWLFGTPYLPHKYWQPNDLTPADASDQSSSYDTSSAYGAASTSVGASPKVSVDNGVSANASSVSMAPADNGVGSYGGASGYQSSGQSGSYYGSSSYSGYGNWSDSGYSGSGYSDSGPPSVITPSDSEALMYFDIAADLGHPLAKDYASSQIDYMSQYGDVPSIVAMAAARARYWEPPFEFYPGTTAGGVPHSDESEPNFAQRIALTRVHEIPFYAIQDALAFRGLLRRTRGPWAVSPAAVAQAIRKFQSALNFEPTGFLAPRQTVRLIQMAAVDGDAESQNRLGIMYAKGIGVARNFVRARDWFDKAAKQNYGEALYNLGVLYKVGPDGVAQDKDKAARLFVDSALAGFNPTRSELKDLLAQADGPEHAARR
ncbi:MAG: sel1 repeat family protein [Alphaproteobacteria bacterium]|nr:sel1 repeat family protein [Alphaproteobacteria bacterium]MDE2492508.1 sel1 repeat family protein [Alphaproteobacteria bacterium]